MDGYMRESDGSIYGCELPCIAPRLDTIWIAVVAEGHTWWSTRYDNTTVKDFIYVQ